MFLYFHYDVTISLIQEIFWFSGIFFFLSLSTFGSDKILVGHETHPNIKRQARRQSSLCIFFYWFAEFLFASSNSQIPAVTYSFSLKTDKNQTNFALARHLCLVCQEEVQMFDTSLTKVQGVRYVECSSIATSINSHVWTMKYWQEHRSYLILRVIVSLVEVLHTQLG